MLSTYTYPRYAYRRPLELDAPHAVHRRPVVVVGAGPVGLTAAIDLAQQGQPVVLLDDDDTVSIGSRGLCYAKRTLEILDRLGCGQAVVAKGVTWNVGRTFHRDEEVFQFNLQPEPDHCRPGMVNLQQYHLEQCLVERAQSLENLDLRWRHKVVAVKPQGDGAVVQIDTADGRYTLHADWLVVADGARSPVRRMLGLDMAGRVFQDRFLIADVVLKEPMFAEGAAERWFWFDPPFHPGQSVLLHREADNVWRSSPTACCRASAPCWRAAAPRPRLRLGLRLLLRLRLPLPLRHPPRVLNPTRQNLAKVDPTSNSNGSASTPSSAAACSASAMAACSLPVTPRTRCRPSARAVPIPACRTATTWRGN